MLAQQGLNVVDAGITTTPDNHVLDTFHVLEETGEPVSGERRCAEIRDALHSEISTSSRDHRPVSRRMPRQYKHFPIKTHIEFKLDELDQRTVMELITADRPGLLSRVGRAFTDCKVRLLNAKIATLGSRVEDVYYITDQQDRPLTDKAQIECLRRALHKYLDDAD